MEKPLGRQAFNTIKQKNILANYANKDLLTLELLEVTSATIILGKVLLSIEKRTLENKEPLKDTLVRGPFLFID